ncbi:MAG: hypothetical protein WC292_07735 [Clostridia bacterium]
MRKLFAILLIFLTAMALTACNDDPPVVKQPNDDPFITPGFIQGETNSADMIMDLVYSAFNTLKPLTTDDKNKTNVSLLAEAEINLNGVSFLAEFKLNYSPSLPNDITFNLELFTDNTKTVLIGIYYYGTKHNTDMYLSLNDKKIKVTIPKDKPEDPLFPINIENTLSTELHTALTMILTIDGDIRYEYSTFSGGRTRHYLCRIDVPESLKKIISLSNRFGQDITDLNFLMQNLLGVTANDILNDRVPATFLELEFATKGGSQSAFGNGVLSYVNMNIDVAASANVNTVFMGEAYTAEINVKKLEVSRSLFGDLKNKSELSDYAEYTNKAFRFEAEVLYGVPQKQYLLTLDFHLDGEDSYKDKIAAYLKDKESGKNKLTLFYQNNIMYLNVLGDDGIKRGSSFNLVLSDFLEQLELHDEETVSADYMKIIVYILGAIRIEDDMQFSYTVIAKNLFTITNLNAQQLIDMLDAASDDDIKSILENSDFGINKLTNLMFNLKLDLQSDFIKYLDEVYIPQDKGTL